MHAFKVTLSRAFCLGPVKLEEFQMSETMFLIYLYCVSSLSFCKERNNGFIIKPKIAVLQVTDKVASL